MCYIRVSLYVQYSLNRVQTVSLYHFRLNQQTWRDKHRRIFSIFIGPMWRWGHHVCVMFMLSNFVTSIKNTIKINHCSLCDNLQQSMCDILCTIWRGISLVQVFSQLTFALKTNSFIFFFLIKCSPKGYKVISRYIGKLSKQKSDYSQ